MCVVGMGIREVHRERTFANIFKQRFGNCNYYFFDAEYMTITFPLEIKGRGDVL